MSCKTMSKHTSSMVSMRPFTFSVVAIVKAALMAGVELEDL